jgi:hypothetical protein
VAENANSFAGCLRVRFLKNSGNGHMSWAALKGSKKPVIQCQRCREDLPQPTFGIASRIFAVSVREKLGQDSSGTRHALHDTVDARCGMADQPT